MQRNEQAVSPVVGVMLMLVVVIIIAAVVSGFAGSLMQGSSQAPQASIQGILYVNGTGNSPTNLIVLTHVGGDELVTSKIQIVIKKGDEWGSYTDILEGGFMTIDNSAVYDSFGNPWINATTGASNANTTVWRPGESMYINKALTNSDNIGKSIDLEVTTRDGKMISKSKMKVVS